MIQEPRSSLRPLLLGDLGHSLVILQVDLVAKGDFSSSKCACLLSHRPRLIAQPLGQRCLAPLKTQPMFSYLQALLVLTMLIQGLGQGQCFLRCCQVLQPVGDGFFAPPQADKHGDIFLGVPLRLSQIQVLLETPAPLQDVKPGIGKVICVNGTLSVPGPLLVYSPLEDPLEWRIIPAVESRRLRRIKCFIHAIVIEFRLPGSELISPLRSLLAGQVRTQDRFRPGGSAFTEEAADLTIPVLQVLPLAHVFFWDTPKYRNPLATLIRLYPSPSFLHRFPYPVPPLP